MCIRDSCISFHCSLYRNGGLNSCNYLHESADLCDPTYCAYYWRVLPTMYYRWSTCEHRPGLHRPVRAHHTLHTAHPARSPHFICTINSSYQFCVTPRIRSHLWPPSDSRQQYLTSTRQISTVHVTYSLCSFTQGVEGHTSLDWCSVVLLRFNFDLIQSTWWTSISWSNVNWT